MVATGPREMAAAAWTIGAGQLGRYGVGGSSKTDRFESELAEHSGALHALAVNSGTSALICALAALGVGPGDEVLVPAYTWIATAAAPVVLGAVPILVEIDDTLTMDPVDLESKITPQSKAIIPVHMLNLPANMGQIMNVARRHHLVVVEDACQAVGVTYKGRALGSIGDAGAFSFNQHKNLRAGEGGAMLTSDNTVKRRAQIFHDAGSFIRDVEVEADVPTFVGMNLRMPEISSAMLRPQLKRLSRQMKRRADRREMMLGKLATRSDIEACPHNDERCAVGLAVQLPSSAEAKQFATAKGVNRLIDTDRHVYSNWTSILQKRTVDERRNPWLDRDIDYEDCCPRTLEILARTCSVSVDPDIPMAAMRRFADKMVATTGSSLRVQGSPDVVATGAA